MIECQLRLLDEEWPLNGVIRVRMALYSGQAQIREGDYFGTVVNRTTRLMALAGGGQIVLSSLTADLVRDQLPAGATLVELGFHRLRDLNRPGRVFQLSHRCLSADFPPLKSPAAAPNNSPE